MNPFEQIEQTKETYRGQLPKPDDTWPPKVRQALAFIIAHLFDPRLTVGWMKQECLISGNNFTSRFTYCLQKTPNQYITYHRVEVAKILLSNKELTGIKLSTIAYELGFSNVSTFSKSFKRETGMPPSQWRA